MAVSTPAAVLDGADATSGNLAAIPAGLIMALYVTGTGGIPATAAQLARYPDAVRIAQWPVLSADEAVHADVLDVETGAATAAECAPWAVNAEAAWKAGTRPGQRHPAIYCGDGGQTAYVNAMIAAGITSGVGLWIVAWGLTRAQAAARLQANAATSPNPFPEVAIQTGNQGGGGAYDTDVFLASWLHTRSGPVFPPAPPPVAPAFPYPAGHYLGLESADPACHSGYTAADRPHIATWQAQMAVRGWAITADGLFGPVSDGVARAFQSQEHLTADGLVGPATWSASWTAAVT